jgi:hypothetical protein
LPTKKKKRKLIINETSEAIESDQPVDMDDVEIENLNMDQQELVEEIDTDLIQQQSTRKPTSEQHSVESIQVGESTIPTQK